MAQRRPLLQSMPGLDELEVAKRLVEIGDEMQASGAAEKLVSWAGVFFGSRKEACKRNVEPSSDATALPGVRWVVWETLASFTVVGLLRCCAAYQFPCGRFL
ncbi:hypothetical protein CKO41_08870 [Thiococcus pfennigii]|nr:hypothetical protein [Thiococcus pfennigii]